MFLPEEMNGAARERRPLLSDQIRSSLADAIASRELPPGTLLEEQQVADRFGVSRTPVREAIRQLQVGGLVEADGRRIRVAQLTPVRIMEMFEAMAEVEAVCVRLATYRMTLHERGDLLRIHEATRAAAESGDVDEYDRLNGEFHMALYRGTHNSFLIETALAMRGRLVSLRRIQLRQEGRLPRSRGEHDDVLRAIAEGDAETAVRRMRAHMLNAATALDLYFRERDDAV